jgi:hypothetical protein
MFRRCAKLFHLSVAVGLACCVWSSVSQVRAAVVPQSGHAMNFTVEGTVNTLGQNKLTLRAEANVIFHVSYNDKTEFKSEDGSLTGGKDLHIGLAIRVEGDLTESGEIVAQRIELLEKK